MHTAANGHAAAVIVPQSLTQGMRIFIENPLVPICQKHPECVANMISQHEISRGTAPGVGAQLRPWHAGNDGVDVLQKVDTEQSTFVTEHNIPDLLRHEAARKTRRQLRGRHQRPMSFGVAGCKRVGGFEPLMQKLDECVCPCRCASHITGLERLRRPR